jgi:hypothetical protein
VAFVGQVPDRSGVVAYTLIPDFLNRNYGLDQSSGAPLFTITDLRHRQHRRRWLSFFLKRGWSVNAAAVTMLICAIAVTPIVFRSGHRPVVAVAMSLAASAHQAGREPFTRSDVRAARSAGGRLRRHGGRVGACA